MIEGIKNIRAYDFGGNEVNTLAHANVLFIETEEAAQAFYQKYERGELNSSYCENFFWPFVKPGIYVTNEAYSYYWCSLNEYLDGVKESKNYYNSIIAIIDEKVCRKDAGDSDET